MTNKSKKEYQKPQIGKFVGAVCQEFKLDPERVSIFLLSTFPELRDKSHCANCKANMEIAVYTLDVTKVALVIEMSKEIKRRLQQGINFTITNQIHVPSLPTSDGVRHETTHCAKLGLIAKVITKNKTQAPGFWCITKRGFSFLRGESVPKRVSVWRGEIKEHFEETITIDQARHLHEERINLFKQRSKEPRVDLRKTFSDYDPSEWVEYSKTMEGKII